MTFDPLDIARYFDPIDRVEGAISTFIRADWAGAMKRRGAFGLLAEFASCLTADPALIARIRAVRDILVDNKAKIVITSFGLSEVTK